MLNIALWRGERRPPSNPVAGALTADTLARIVNTDPLTYRELVA